MRSHDLDQVTVFIVDDHDIVRRGLRDLMASKRDIRVVGDAASVRVATSAILAAEPDVILVDLQLQDGTGVDVCRAVHLARPDIRSVLLTATSDGHAAEAATLAGASGYLVKAANSLHIVDAVRAVAAGRSIIDPSTVAAARDRLTARAEDGSVFSPVDRELLRAVLDGSSDADIAAAQDARTDAVQAKVSSLVGRLLS